MTRKRETSSERGQMDGELRWHPPRSKIGEGSKLINTGLVIPLPLPLPLPLLVQLLLHNA